MILAYLLERIEVIGKTVQAIFKMKPKLSCSKKPYVCGSGLLIYKSCGLQNCKGKK